mmetsp:Transcript_38259/g.92560  ORF Transcript_38259/g.92560 Transcript_38259/m.92560 type:complete len:213 (+) Transcript_38259:138-776(+)
MAVLPNVTDAHAQALLDATEDVLGPPMIRIARAAKRTKIALEMLQIGVITEEEFGEHRAFEDAVTANAVGDPAIGVLAPPAWFAPAMAAALGPVTNRLDNMDNRLDNMNNRLDNMDNRLDNMNDRLNNMDNRLQNIEARQKNAVANENMDPLHPLLNADGLEFPTFPRTLQMLQAMTGPQMTAFLNHYGIQGGGVNTVKLHRIKKFIGMRIA